MSIAEFFYWFKGYIDGAGSVKLSEAQMAVVKEKMGLVV